MMNIGDPQRGPLCSLHSTNMKVYLFHFVIMFRPDIEYEDKINQDTAYFNVKGLSLGTASLTFTASTAGKGRATSEPKDIQVHHHINNRAVSHRATIHQSN